jgi:hypothetical protein
MRSSWFSTSGEVRGVKVMSAWVVRAFQAAEVISGESGGDVLAVIAQERGDVVLHVIAFFDEGFQFLLGRLGDGGGGADGGEVGGECGQRVEGIARGAGAQQQGSGTQRGVDHAPVGLGLLGGGGVAYAGHVRQGP